MPMLALRLDREWSSTIGLSTAHSPSRQEAHLGIKNRPINSELLVCVLSTLLSLILLRNVVNLYIL